MTRHRWPFRLSCSVDRCVYGGCVVCICCMCGVTCDTSSWVDIERTFISNVYTVCIAYKYINFSFFLFYQRVYLTCIQCALRTSTWLDGWLVNDCSQLQPRQLFSALAIFCFAP